LTYTLPPITFWKRAAFRISPVHSLVAKEGAMDALSHLGKFFADNRFLFNLLATNLLLLTTLIVSVVLRRLLTHGSNHLVHLTGWHWLRGVSREATRRARDLLFWVTLAVMGLIVLAGATYHVCGRDIRHDLAFWYGRLTWRELVPVGLAVGELVLLGLGLWLVVRQVRRLLPGLKRVAGQWLGKRHEESLGRWFAALERYAVVMVVLAALWCTGQIVGLGAWADTVVGIVFRVLAILAAAHLLTLACRTLSHGLAALGNRHLATGKFHRYWERLTRLFPFGERCFEAAVYVSAASLCIRELTFIAVIAAFGPRIVQCIGIFFGTRVVIELSQVLLNEAFGMYEEDRPAAQLDQKGQTLVPLLQSMCQYVLYFGSGVMMLSVLGIPTSPILAGAGILGLAGGLGAQSLITDVVSGFFILFENQYLVGDYVRLGEAGGRVEAVSIRCTQIRDDQGRLHIIPNGQIKGVINYSKGYVIAEVDITVPADTNLDSLFNSMSEAGRRLRLTRKEVLGDTVVKGLVDLTLSNMTVRAATKVRPGTHLLIQSEYRRLLKQVLDESKAARPPALAA
jgi:small-conductance mechanosensitive channel